MVVALLHLKTIIVNVHLVQIHSGKYQGSYACSNLGNPGNHSQALLYQGVVPGQRPTQITITLSSHLRLR